MSTTMIRSALTYRSPLYNGARFLVCASIGGGGLQLYFDFCFLELVHFPLDFLSTVTALAGSAKSKLRDGGNKKQSIKRAILQCQDRRGFLSSIQKAFADSW
jgi:hypothetical protein